MKERPILFNAPMIRAILANTKTQTRRIFKPERMTWDANGRYTTYAMRGGELSITGSGPFEPSSWLHYCPYGQPGDRLAVRETFYAWGHWTKRYSEKKRREEWHFVDETMGTGKAYRYEADEKLPRRKRELHEVGWWKRPAIFMPRAASRITLEVTGVRVERLQDIDLADALAEGISDTGALILDSAGNEQGGPIAEYAVLWEQINGPGSWAANPWVWVISFKKVTAP